MSVECPNQKCHRDFTKNFLSSEITKKTNISTFTTEKKPTNGFVETKISTQNLVTFLKLSF